MTAGLFGCSTGGHKNNHSDKFRQYDGILPEKRQAVRTGWGVPDIKKERTALEGRRPGRPDSAYWVCQDPVNMCGSRDVWHNGGHEVAGSEAEGIRIIRERMTNMPY